MRVNADKPQRWKQDIARSVDFYNDWFLRFAPRAYRDTRKKATEQVEGALRLTCHLRDVSTKVLLEHPQVVQMLRMATAPPIARDRLTGLAKVPQNLVSSYGGPWQNPATHGAQAGGARAYRHRLNDHATR